MNNLNERELTRLSYLMSSLVVSPELYIQFIETMHLNQGTQQVMNLVQDLSSRISMNCGSKPTRDELSQVAQDLIKEKQPELVTMGRLLAAALETYPSKRPSKNKPETPHKIIKAASSIIDFINKNGKIQNHGHRHPDSNCSECKIINNLEEALEEYKK